MKKSKAQLFVLLTSVVSLLVLTACAGCNTDPPLRTGGAAPMDNKSKPATKQQQGGQAVPMGGAGDVTK